MGVMSRALVRRLLIPALMAGVLFGAGIVYANAPSLAALTASGLLPSDIPMLLGPISESGRVGWACKPEKAAGSSAADAGELPQVSSGPSNIALDR